MGARLTTFAAAVCFALAASSLPIVAATPAVQEVALDLAETCPMPQEAAPAVELPAFLSSIPDGIAVTALAHHRAAALPAGAEFDASLDRLVLPVEQVIRGRRLAGPTLFLVEQGTVDVSDGPHARPEAGPSGFQPGDSVLLDLMHLAGVVNTGGEPAAVLLFAILPPGEVTRIGAYGAPAVIWMPLVDQGERHAHRQMASADGLALPQGETLVFAACLHWTDASAELSPMHYPGPVGLLVLRGQALVNGVHHLGAGGCWIAPANTPFGVAASDEATDVVLFGAWNASHQPFPSDAASAVAVSLPCAGPVDDDLAE